MCFIWIFKGCYERKYGSYGYAGYRGGYGSFMEMHGYEWGFIDGTGVIVMVIEGGHGRSYKVDMCMKMDMVM